MRKEINSILDFEYALLEKISFIILLLWVVSPVVEYFLKWFSSRFYTYYFSFIIYIIGLLGIGLYIIYFLKLKRDNKVNIRKFIPEILIGVLLIISIIASILSKNPQLSILGEGYRREGLVVYVMYIGILLMTSIIKNSKYMKYLLKGIIIAALIITIVPLLSNSFTYLNFTNVFHNLNHYGYYLMINIMLSAFMFIDSDKLLKKIFYLLTNIFFIHLLIRNDTFGSYLAIMITLAILFIYAMIKKHKRMDITIVVIAFVVTSFFVSHYDIKIGERINFNSTKGTIARNLSFLSRDIKSFIDNDEEGIDKAGSLRGILWKEAWNYTLLHPVFGGGMESVGVYYNEKQVGNSDRPHNIMLQTSSSIGIPGAIIYLALILYIAISNLKLMNKNTIHMAIYFTAMCYFISSMFGNSMYYTSPYFMILLGLLVGYTRRKEKIRLTK